MIKAKKKFVVILDGPMGSGKTTVAKLLHGKLKRTSHIGLDRIKWFISDFKRIPEDNEIVRSVVLAMTKEYLKHGINVIVEQGMRKERIDALRRVARQYEARCYAYQLDAPKHVLLKRLRERPTLPDRPRVSNARIERNYKAYIEQHKKPIASVLDAGKMSADEITKRILRDIR